MTSLAAKSRPSRKRVVMILAVLAITLAGLWQVDLVRQNAQILWTAVTGRVWKLRGHVRTVTVWSPALSQSRLLYVYTPPGYDKPDERLSRYPVLYLLHGSPGVPTAW